MPGPVLANHRTTAHWAWNAPSAIAVPPGQWLMAFWIKLATKLHQHCSVAQHRDTRSNGQQGMGLAVILGKRLKGFGQIGQQRCKG